MKKAINKLILLVFTCFAAGWCIGITQANAQSSVLQSGKWYKVAIAKNGVYKIDLALFKKMGFPANVDPRKIKIHGNEGGMLPQANNVARPTDLVENAIFVSGENDGVFNAGDYILFYAQGADKISFDVSKETFYYQHNLYADKNYYFITVGETSGKRISTSTDAGIGTVVTTFENFAYHELDQTTSELKSGREWYGEKFDFTTELTTSFSLSDIVPGSEIKLVSDVMAKSFTGSSFKIFFNGIQVGQQIVPSVVNSQYGLKGSDKRDTIVFNENTVSASGQSTQSIKYQYIKNPSGIGFLDYFLLKVKQELKLIGAQTSFRSLESLNNAISKYEINNAASQTIVWDITSPYEPLLQSSSFNSGKISFATTSTSIKEFIAFSSASSPELVGTVANQNIRGIAIPNYVIVTHPDLKSEAMRLAEHRNALNGISVAVITTSEIYNEFSGGRQDVSAIRDFAKSLYDREPATLKAMLLFGKGSYDYKNRVTNNINLIPIYESRNSLDPLKTYSSDDFYSFFQSNEGEWGEQAPFVNHTMDISVGRFPVKNITEAKNVVDKIIRYDSDGDLRGKWRKEIVFVADDGDFNLHQDDANDLAEYIDATHKEFNTKKIFLDTYPQESRPSGEISVETNKLIEETFNTGALIINYTGHGGEKLWAQEKIFDDLMILRLQNKKLPLLVTATCEFGRQDDPVFISGAELCLLHKDGGAIGLVTTSRPVNAATNFILNEAFYDSFFEKENNQYLTLGEIFRRTKNNSISGVSNRNFSLIGDPMLRLAMPRENIIVNEIETESGSPTLKALSTVSVKGIVADQTGDTISNFNGVLEATLFDKETSFLTLGNENQPYPYKQWYNALFRGKATVENGVFEFQFVVPKNIAYQIDEGKLSLYAHDTISNVEASGYSQNFDIGSSEPNPDPDSTSPLLSLFMGDVSFVNGGITNSNTTLVGKLNDVSGINISGYGVGNSIVGILDGSESFILNDFYEADVDDFTKGTILFPLNDLSPGKHSIIVKAWDTHNNPIQSALNFVVTDGDNITIETFGAYPNPFAISTSLFFTHNRSGDDLQVSVAIYDYTGSYIESYEIEVPSSPYHVDLITLNRQAIKNRSGGLYFARLRVRSLTNGSKNEQVTKLIMSN